MNFDSLRALKVMKLVVCRLKMTISPKFVGENDVFPIYVQKKIYKYM